MFLYLQKCDVFGHCARSKMLPFLIHTRFVLRGYKELVMIKVLKVNSCYTQQLRKLFKNEHNTHTHTTPRQLY